MNPGNNNRKSNQKGLYRTMWICIFMGILYANFTSGFAKDVIGCLSTFLILWKLLIFNKEDGYLLLFGTQFLRAVIRVGFGGHSFSFLLFAFPIYLLKLLFEQKGRIHGTVLVAAFVMVWDFAVSFNSSIIRIGDQLLWGGSFILLLVMLRNSAEIDLDKLIVVFGIAIWGICLVNIFAEICKFGKTMVPSMYGVWNQYGEYYMFGKGYPEIAGGNEIAQYIPIFIGMAFFSLNGKDRKVKLFYLVSSLFFSYCGMMCIARAFYVEMAIILFFALVYLSHNPKRLILISFLFTTMVIFSYDRLSGLFEPVLNAVGKRFGGGYGSRAGLIKGTIQVWKSSASNFLFGIGTEYNEVYDTAHNIVFDALVSLGTLGASVYFGTLLIEGRKALQKKETQSIVRFAPLVMLLLYKMISGCLKDVPFYFMIGICLLFAQKYELSKDKSGRVEV